MLTMELNDVKTLRLDSHLAPTLESGNSANGGSTDSPTTQIYSGDRTSLFARGRPSEDHSAAVSSPFATGPANGALAHDNQQYNNGFLIPSPTRAGQSRHQRSASFSEQAIHAIAVPVSVPLVVICLSWYCTSAMSNTLNKTILTSFPYPVTLSMVQFVMAVFFGYSSIQLAMRYPRFYASLPRGVVSQAGLRPPTLEILKATAPMGLFQLSGHIFSHMATSLIPVSLVHTIKALSPLFTVAAYRIIFNHRYRLSTYLSLIPLTTGVVMTCAQEFSTHFAGLAYALTAALIFVSQNMFSKKLLTPSQTQSSEKLCKLEILCYCSSLAFIFTSPLWFFSEGIGIFRDFWQRNGPFFTDMPASTTLSTSQLMWCFFLNGFVHFAQNLLAFQVLGMVSPVTYSVASLIKRIVVITVAIVWFGQQVTRIQGWGVLLTFAGLYLYDRCGGDKAKGYTQGPSGNTGILPK